MIFINQYH
ncbi:hypothetical protein F383_18735 [Gossypium arboreum]|uniref:Uncharacterized protein n=1 Tax=Gossypium arboreum TaxID=29729 RepID=A0A0B0MLM6_GOSAR|nr:hypothetical protein F383_18735 [Gossypium arboreum]